MIRRDPPDRERRWRRLGALVVFALFVAVSSLAWSDHPDLPALSILTDGDDTEAASSLQECPPAVASPEPYVAVRSTAWSEVTDPSASLSHVSPAAPTNKRAPPSH